ncbi:uncharacterized protein LOC130646099 [Hydractinia symbiolongicarpus]|uniref:uncharacterized protein LOC130646099 n=1 Tax=Hydractinia symbiolongicarpus TaxID=13093 RepID=UPI00254A476F|nr:uncharacterized protein LOC130646099 [Hydractinia symbiolongicarpus]
MNFRLYTLSSQMLFWLCLTSSGASIVAQSNVPKKVVRQGDVYLIGIFSVCSQYGVSKFNLTAFAGHLGLVNIIASEKFGYVSYDVCNDTSLLLQILMSLAFDQYYVYNSDVPPITFERCSCAKSSAAVLGVIGVMSDDMAKLAANIMMPLNISFFSYNKFNIIPDVENSHPNYIPFKGIVEMSLHIKNVMSYFKWKRLVLLCDHCNVMQDLFLTEVWSALTDITDTCISYYKVDKSINGSNIDDFVNILTNDKINIVFGGMDNPKGFRVGDELFKALIKRNITNKVWFLELGNYPYNLNYIDRRILHGLFVMWNRLSLSKTPNVMDVLNPIITENQQIDDLYITTYLNNYKHNKNLGELRDVTSIHNAVYNYVSHVAFQFIHVFSTYTWWTKQKIIENIKLRIRYTIRFYNQNTTGVPYHRYSYDDSQKIMFNSWHIPKEFSWPNNQKNAPISVCSKQECPPSFENRKEHFLSHETLWQKEYSWVCRKCKPGHFKSKIGNQSCIKCNEHLIANDQQTACIDPYQNEHLSIFDIPVLISEVVSLTGLLWQVFVITVFVKFRKTPCVKSSNFVMSITQLITFAVFFPFYSYVTIEKPSFLICTVKPCVIGIILTFGISITLSKTQKLLFAFQAKTKLTRSALILTKATEVLILSLLLLIDCAIIAASYLQIKVEVREHPDNNVMKRYFYCSTDNNVLIHAVFLLCLSITCNVQGFRARKLPQNFNETKFILYGTFVFSLVMVMLFPLYYSQQNPLTKAVLNLILPSIGILLLSIILYGNKVFIILLHPEKNTAKSFRKGVLENMRKRVEKETRRREKKILRESTSNQRTSSVKSQSCFEKDEESISRKIKENS